MRLSYHTVRAGYGSDLMKMYRSYWVPIYDHLLEAGVIGAYGVIEQAVHSDTSFTHLAWFEFNSLANLDKVESLVCDAAEQNAQVILPPELFQGIYFCSERPRGSRCRGFGGRCCGPQARVHEIGGNRRSLLSIDPGLEARWMRPRRISR